MRIAVSSYSFSAYLGDGRLDIFGAIRKTAELGFEGIEFTGIDAPTKDDARARARKIRKAAGDAGLPIVCYAVSGNFIRAEGWKFEAERIRFEVEQAAELGVPVMRHDAAYGFPDNWQGERTFEAALPQIADGCRAVTEYAATLGIKSTIENHGFLVQDSDRCEKLMKTVNHPNFGWLIDIGNFLCADEQPTGAVKRAAPYAFHCHAKDFHVKDSSAADPGRGWFRSRGGNFLRGAIVGHGAVDVPACLAAIKQGGYDGWLSLEFEGIEDNMLALSIGLENLRKYLG